MAFHSTQNALRRSSALPRSLLLFYFRPNVLWVVLGGGLIGLLRIWLSGIN
jgi:hypothetical protein